MKKTSDAKKGGVFYGKSHATGGIKAVIVDDSRPIEVEGGEVIINKHAAKKHWRELSKINQSAGGGVPIHEPTFENGGEVESAMTEDYKNGSTIYSNYTKDKEAIYKEWSELVNMSYDEIKTYYNSEDGRSSGMKATEAEEQGIKSGRESARWIMIMKKINYKNWTNEMWVWAKRQIAFIKRMSGVKGDLVAKDGTRTRKYKALLIWGNNPIKN